jgi:phosphoglycolate phosphatase-like HAD superfamily hydrolase
MLGLAPILDFDGTVARLPVDWEGLRRRLGVSRIDDLWHVDPSRWAVVTAAETKAARRAAPIAAVLGRLDEVRGFGVLTSNSSRAVHAFFTRFPDAASRLAIVVGREELEGPKSDFARFRSGLGVCINATAEMREDGAVVFVGNASYELEFARRLSLTALDVADIVRADLESAPKGSS